jgi:anti-sigma B factor antagonist
VARDAETLTEVIEDFATRGYVHSFQVVAVAGDGPPRVRCLHCRSESAPAAMPVEGVMRLEGASDPDEMMIVVASVCPVCGSRGTLTLGYGPMASSEDDDVLTALPELRRVLQAVLDDGVRHLVLDFQGVTFIDSSGLGVLVGALKRLNEGGDDGVLEVRGMSAPVRKVFEITGLTEIFVISD